MSNAIITLYDAIEQFRRATVFPGDGSPQEQPLFAELHALASNAGMLLLTYLGQHPDVIVPHLRRLTKVGSMAVASALRSLPDDRRNPVPLCERISQVIDVLQPLTHHPELPASDRVILLAFCCSDHRLFELAELITVLDRIQLASMVEAGTL